MAREATRYKINGRTYIITDWTVDKSLKTLVWLTKTFGEGILQLFIHPDGLEAADRVLGSGEEKEELSDKDRSVAESFVAKILGNLSPDEYTKYVKEILKDVACDGKDFDFNQHFIGRIGELHSVVFQVLRHQYSDFLGGNDEGGS